ncbi:TrmH family RNA methyltransferase [Olleya marilimosa]|uniref:TrmH family RNA methyltransferase n=1 Tax=Olleya marilimosa TaxID=272164 RepID=A0ABR8LSC3_9FLAO|nr:TrmH family RNA methyltransferase [Olleya marilimosa]MBD3861869.1 TrmH family RNA methyltransferase [Olleya marilimosa]MBD3889365.1 TrmH family RNA methyltransferase [Olleya marilimosa]
MQLTHYTTKFNQQQFPITVVSENVSNAPNIGSLFRACDAFGIEKLIFCGTDIPLGRKMTKTSRSTEKSVNYQIQKSALEVVTKLKQDNYFIISLEISTNSQALNNINFNIGKPIAIIIGDENFGVSEDILNISDAIAHINMYGQNSSMNVVQATSITLYEITKQLSQK